LRTKGWPRRRRFWSAAARRRFESGSSGPDLRRLECGRAALPEARYPIAPQPRLRLVLRSEEAPLLRRVASGGTPPRTGLRSASQDRTKAPALHRKLGGHATLDYGSPRYLNRDVCNGRLLRKRNRVSLSLACPAQPVRVTRAGNSTAARQRYSAPGGTSSATVTPAAPSSRRPWR
jgi:hypothetical protein